MEKDQKGFSGVQAIMALVIVGLIGFVGWNVNHNRANKSTSSNSSSKTSTTVKQAPSDNTPSSLSKYEDDFVSFSYPSDWKVEKQHTFTDDYGAYWLFMIAPIDSSLKASDPGLTKLYLSTKILIAKNDRFGAGGVVCHVDCTIYHIDKISPKSPSSPGSLVISDWNSQGYARVVEYTKSDVALGQKTYDLGLYVTSSYYARIYGSYLSGDLIPDVKLATDSDFQNSQSYKQLKELIPTLTVKTSRLP